MTTDLRILPYVKPAQNSHAKFWPRGPFVSCTLAQGIIESAYFTATSGRNNFFGIKATAVQIAAGRATLRWTHETLNGVYKTMPQYFADYDSVEECFDAHANLLTQSWYADCVAARTPQAYAHALWKDHYATGIPSEPYDAVLIAVMADEDLYQFDQVGPFVFGVLPSTTTP